MAHNLGEREEDMTTHGMRGHPLYKTWCEMRYRCENPKKHNYQHYGGRGIKVCNRWSDFATFVADMGPRPANHTLERRDNDGNYTPGNCYWATKWQQMNNQRSNRKLSVLGVTLNLCEMSRRHGIKFSVVWARLNLGWSDERAVLTPVRRMTISANSRRV